MNALKKLVYRHTPKFIRRVRFSRFRRAWVPAEVVVNEHYLLHEMSDEELWAEMDEFSLLDAQHYNELLAAELAWKRRRENIRHHGVVPR